MDYDIELRLPNQKDEPDRYEALAKYLKRLYVPKEHKEAYNNVWRIIWENPYRGIKEDDAGRYFLDCLIIETKGKGAYETFQGYKVCRVDVGSVRDTLVDIAIYSNDSSAIVTPMRVKRGNIKINLPA